jgi:hypothetical protein|eukprot:COSAG01_NODE_6372_length_3706_cov_11.559745_3_plen_87_part_00
MDMAEFHAVYQYLTDGEAPTEEGPPAEDGPHNHMPSLHTVELIRGRNGFGIKVNGGHLMLSHVTVLTHALRLCRLRRGVQKLAGWW